MTIALTEKRLLAIREALSFRLSGDLGDTTMERRTYVDTLEWARGKIAEKQRRRKYSSEARRLAGETD